MTDDADNDDNVEHLAKIISELSDVLAEGSATVKLQGGRKIVGPILGLSLKRKEKKGNVTWTGSLRVQIDTGDLDVNFDTIESIAG